MVEDTDVHGFEEEFAGGAIRVEVAILNNKTSRISLKNGGKQLWLEDYDRVFETGKYPRDQRKNICTEIHGQLAEIEGIDEESVEKSVSEWFEELKSVSDEAERELAGPLVNEMIEGTHTPVEVREAPDENTTWHVELEFRGRSRELEFDADVMVPGSDGSDTLAAKLVNNFHERVEVTKEDWDEIAQYWDQQKKVVDRTEETPKDTISNRLLSFIANRVEPTKDKDKIGNSVSTAWIDTEGNETDGVDGPVVWVHNQLLDDEIESIGKSLDDKGDINKHLRRRNDLLDSSRKRSWTEGRSRLKMWAFDPDAINVDPDRDSGIGEPASSEVSP